MNLTEEIRAQMLEHFNQEIDSLQTMIEQIETGLAHDRIRLAKLAKFRDAISTQPEFDLPSHAPTH